MATRRSTRNAAKTKPEYFPSARAAPATAAAPAHTDAPAKKPTRSSRAAAGQTGNKRASTRKRRGRKASQPAEPAEPAPGSGTPRASPDDIVIKEDEADAAVKSQPNLDSEPEKSTPNEDGEPAKTRSRPKKSSKGKQKQKSSGTKGRSSRKLSPKDVADRVEEEAVLRPIADRNTRVSPPPRRATRSTRSNKEAAVVAEELPARRRSQKTNNAAAEPVLPMASPAAITGSPVKRVQSPRAPLDTAISPILTPSLQTPRSAASSFSGSPTKVRSVTSSPIVIYRPVDKGPETGDGFTTPNKSAKNVENSTPCDNGTANDVFGLEKVISPPRDMTSLPSPIFRPRTVETISGDAHSPIKSSPGPMRTGSPIVSRDIASSPLRPLSRTQVVPAVWARNEHAVIAGSMVNDTEFDGATGSEFGRHEVDSSDGEGEGAVDVDPDLHQSDSETAEKADKGSLSPTQRAEDTEDLIPSEGISSPATPSASLDEATLTAATPSLIQGQSTAEGGVDHGNANLEGPQSAFVDTVSSTMGHEGENIDNHDLDCSVAVSALEGHSSPTISEIYRQHSPVTNLGSSPSKSSMLGTPLGAAVATSTPKSNRRSLSKDSVSNSPAQLADDGTACLEEAGQRFLSAETPSRSPVETLRTPEGRTLLLPGDLVNNDFPGSAGFGFGEGAQQWPSPQRVYERPSNPTPSSQRPYIEVPQTPAESPTQNDPLGSGGGRNHSPASDDEWQCDSPLPSSYAGTPVHNDPKHSYSVVQHNTRENANQRPLLEDSVPDVRRSPVKVRFQIDDAKPDLSAVDDRAARTTKRLAWWAEQDYNTDSEFEESFMLGQGLESPRRDRSDRRGSLTPRAGRGSPFKSELESCPETSSASGEDAEATQRFPTGRMPNAASLDGLTADRLQSPTENTGLCSEGLPEPRLDTTGGHSPTRFADEDDDLRSSSPFDEIVCPPSPQKAQQRASPGRNVSPPTAAVNSGTSSALPSPPRSQVPAQAPPSTPRRSSRRLSYLDVSGSARAKAGAPPAASEIHLVDPQAPDSVTRKKYGRRESFELYWQQREKAVHDSGRRGQDSSDEFPESAPIEPGSSESRNETPEAVGEPDADELPDKHAGDLPEEPVDCAEEEGTSSEVEHGEPDNDSADAAPTLPRRGTPRRSRSLKQPDLHSLIPVPVGNAASSPAKSSSSSSSMSSAPSSSLRERSVVTSPKASTTTITAAGAGRGIRKQRRMPPVPLKKTRGHGQSWEDRLILDAEQNSAAYRMYMCEFRRSVVRLEGTRPDSPNPKRSAQLADYYRKKRAEIKENAGVTLGPGESEIVDFWVANQKLPSLSPPGSPTPRSRKRKVVVEDEGGNDGDGRAVHWATPLQDKIPHAGKRVKLVDDEQKVVIYQPKAVESETDDSPRKSPVKGAVQLKSCLKSRGKLNKFGCAEPQPMSEPTSPVYVTKYLYDGEEDEGQLYEGMQRDEEDEL